MGQFPPVIVLCSLVQLQRVEKFRSKMRFRFFLILSIIIGTTMAQGFSPRDIDMAFSNDRAFGVYFRCLIGESRCTPKGEQLKEILPDLMATGCSNCSEQEKRLAKMVVRRMQKERKAEWIKLKQVYDPHNEYDHALDHFMSS